MVGFRVVSELAAIPELGPGNYSFVVTDAPTTTTPEGVGTVRRRVSGGSVKLPRGGPNVAPTVDRTESQGTFTATAAQATALDIINTSDIYDPFLYTINDPAIDDNSGVQLVGGRGVNVFSTDQSAISIEANAPEIEYRDGLLPRSPGFDGNLDNLIVTYPNNTDLAGTPLTSTFEIPVVNDITYNADDPLASD